MSSSEDEPSEDEDEDEDEEDNWERSVKAAVVLMSEQVDETLELMLDGTSFSCEDATAWPSAPRVRQHPSFSESKAMSLIPALILPRDDYEVAPRPYVMTNKVTLIVTLSS